MAYAVWNFSDNEKFKLYENRRESRLSELYLTRLDWILFEGGMLLSSKDRRLTECYA